MILSYAFDVSAHTALAASDFSLVITPRQLTTGLGYPTLDYLPDLSASDMQTARTLSFGPYSQTGSTYEKVARVGGSEPYAILHDTYTFQATAGATYQVVSTSYFDPFLAEVYDKLGNVIAASDARYDAYGEARLTFVAPYTGTYYVSAGWNQGAYYTAYALSVFEDIHTAAPKMVSQNPPYLGDVASLSSNLQLIFNESVFRGNGTVTLFHQDDAGARVVDETFNTAVSNRLTINGKTVTVDPTQDLDQRQLYFVEITPGAFKDADDIPYAGTDLHTGQVYVFRTYTVADQKLVGGPGNELFTGGPGFDTIDGGTGTDVAQYGGNYGLYKVTVGAGSVTVADSRTVVHASDNTDTLMNVERLQFSDLRLALDLSPAQAGGEAALMLGAAVGAPALANKALVGLFLGYFDLGFSVLDGAKLLVDAGIMAAFAAGQDNTAFARYVYANVNGNAPDAATLAKLVAPLDAHTITQAQWLADMATSAANQTHVNLTGYAGTGLQYTL